MDDKQPIHIDNVSRADSSQGAAAQSTEASPTMEALMAADANAAPPEQAVESPGTGISIILVLMLSILAAVAIMRRPARSTDTTDSK